MDPPPLPDDSLLELGEIERLCRASGMETIAFTRPAMVRRLVAERNRLAVLLYRVLSWLDERSPERAARSIRDRTYTGKFPLTPDETVFLKILFGDACQPEKFDDDE